MMPRWLASALWFCGPFAVLLVLWAFGSSIGLSTAASAFGAIAVLLLTGVLAWDHVSH